MTGVSEWPYRSSSRTEVVVAGWEQPHSVHDAAQGIREGGSGDVWDSSLIPWELLLSSASAGLRQPLPLVKVRKQTLHSLAHRSAPGVWIQRSCSVIPAHTESSLILQIIPLKSKLRGFQRDLRLFSCLSASLDKCLYFPLGPCPISILTRGRDFYCLQ